MSKIGTTGKLAILTAIAGALLPFDGGVYANGGTRIEDLDLSPKRPPIPKGCKEYFFNAKGKYSNDSQHTYAYGCYFKCIASSDKVAIKKFKKWAATQF